MSITTDHHGNQIAQEGVTRCWCGSKYWHNDRCVDCGTPATSLVAAGHAMHPHPACEWCGSLATHLAIRADESEYLLCHRHAKDIREALRLAKGCVNLGANPGDTVKVMTRQACLTRHGQMEERFTRAEKALRRLVLSHRPVTVAGERQIEDRYCDAVRKFNLATRRCRLLGMDVPGL